MGLFLYQLPFLTSSTIHYCVIFYGWIEDFRPCTNFQKMHEKNSFIQLLFEVSNVQDSLFVSALMKDHLRNVYELDSPFFSCGNG